MAAASWKTFLAGAARGGLKARGNWSSLACLTSLSIAFKIKIWRFCASITVRKIGLDVDGQKQFAQKLDFVSTPSQPVLEKLREVDLNRLTPLEALNLLAELKKEI